MPAERTPQETSTFIEKPLLALTRLVLKFPISTLVVGGLLALAAMAWSNARLGFRTNRLDLLNPKSDFNRLWIEYIREFGDEEDVIVVVEGSEPEKVRAVRDELAATLGRETRMFHSVLSGVDTSKLESKGLYYLPLEKLRQIERFVETTGPVVHDRWARLSVGAMVGAICGSGPEPGPGGAAAAPAAQAQAARLLGGLRAALGGQYQSPWPEVQSPDSDPQSAAAGQMLANGGRIGFVLLKLVKEDSSADFVRGSKPIEALRRLIGQAQARHPQIKIGATGLPVIEHDEMGSSQTSMAQVSLLSLVGVSLLFVAGFGGWRHPLLAVTSLSVGTAWSMGYITLFIGHLNILSSAFAVILIGQGIDFSMYYVAEYLQLRRSVPSSRDALLQTVAKVGPSVATGAVTTAVAFFMAGLTEFTGVAELGIVAGGGILLCWIAGLTLLPAMICLIDSRWPSKHVPRPVDVRSWLEPILARPRILLAVTCAGTLVLVFGLSRLRYDHNLLHMQARGLESVDLEQKLLHESEHNASFALSIAAGRDEVLARKARFLALPSVKRVEEIASRFPEDAEEKRPIIARISRGLAHLPAAAPTVPVSTPDELAELVRAARSGALRGPQAGELPRLVDEIGRRLETLAPAECYARVSRFQQQMAEELLARLRGLRAAAAPEPPNLSDLPESLVSRFVSPSGRHLLKIYSKGDIWDMSAMEQFVREVRSVDPRATGNPLQVYEASLQMKRSYEEAAWYAMAIILPVVFLEFLTVRHTLLALLPLGVGMLQMFGLMGLLGIPLNPANMIVLPLILGIGIDAGVHVVHDYCSQHGRYRINASTASAVVINTATNMAGFGSLMIASHRGLESLGRVITLGLACCLFTSLVMLPALLVLSARNRRERIQEPPEDQEAGPAVVPIRRIYRKEAA